MEDALVIVEKQVRLSGERAEHLQRLAKQLALTEDQVIAQALDTFFQQADVPDEHTRYDNWDAASFKVDKTAFSVASLDEEPDDKEFWLAKTPYERLQGVELMRQVIYGYQPASARLQRFFEIAELNAG